MCGRRTGAARRTADPPPGVRPHCKAQMAGIPGFTLIELLVVIAIIAMLMALLFPVLSRVRKQAQAVACQSGMHGWAVLFAAYQNDNDGRFPEGRDEAGNIAWPRQMETHSRLDLRKAMLCPTASRLQTPGTFPTRGSFVACGTTFVAWLYGLSGSEGGTDGARSEYNGSYAMNNLLRHIGRSETIKPSARPAFFDARDCLAGLYSANASEPPPFEDAPIIGSSYYYSAQVAIDRHQGGINMLFADGAIRKIGVKELWTLAWDEEFDTAGPWTKAGGVLPEDWPAWMRKFKDY